MSLGNIILVGMPGSGKTTLGKVMSKRLGMPFLDTDRVIEQTAGGRVSDIFKNHGERAFRVLEREAVKKAASMRGIIIATGGGAWEDDGNRSSLKKSGSVIYLYCSLEELWRRLERSPVARPLLKKGYDSLNDLYHRRHGLYMDADLVVDTSGKKVEECADEIIYAAGFKKAKRSAGNSVHTINISFAGDRKCDVITGSGIIEEAGSLLAERLSGKEPKPRLMVVTNPYVNALCGEELLKSLRKKGYDAGRFIVPDGEQHKTPQQAVRICSRLAEEGFDRGDFILALGGGVTGDMAGFAAAVYMRGMGLIQAPTTLLAQVDSSIGGKTAVNLPEGKNLVGAFHQPRLVLSDAQLLAHLPDYQLRQGLAECVKYGLLDRQGLFGVLEQWAGDIRNREPSVLADVVRRCCLVKAGIVERDERDMGLRRILNLGHTVGHALEAAAGYGRLGHGDAVALGIRAKAYISREMGIMKESDFRRITALLDAFGFPKKGCFPLDKVKEYLARDKKKRQGSLLFVLPSGVGSVEEAFEIPPAQLEKGLRIVGCK